MRDPDTDALQKASILIVEDNLLIALELEELFNEAGATTITCTTSNEALQMLDEAPVNFLLTDYFLQGDDSRILIAEAVARSIPYALLTGYPLEGVKDGADGPVTVFTKPVNPQKIIEHIVATLTTFEVRSNRAENSEDERFQAGNL